MQEKKEKKGKKGKVGFPSRIKLKQIYGRILFYYRDFLLYKTFYII